MSSTTIFLFSTSPSIIIEDSSINFVSFLGIRFFFLLGFGYTVCTTAGAKLAVVTPPPKHSSTGSSNVSISLVSSSSGYSSMSVSSDSFNNLIILSFEDSCKSYNTFSFKIEK